ncbi:MAG: sigma-54-dependent transcriptional regulator [Myxococcota bacterium]
MRSGTVLVVDDDILLASTLLRALTTLGWQVDVAHSGEAALEMMREQMFDTLVLDLLIPDMDGFQVLERLHEYPPEKRPATILLSGHLDVPSTVRAVRAGAFDVLEKPVSGALLHQRLLAALAVGGRRHALTPKEAETLSRIGGESAAMHAMCDQVRNVARFPDLAVTLIGETGTGKALVAQAIHQLSETEGDFVRVDCAALPEQMFERELFGEDNASGSDPGPKGLLAAAARGTIFFDEIGEIPMPVQAKLLRALECRTYRRVGGGREIPLETRVLSATSRRPTSKDSHIDPDLFFRLAGFTIVMPPLRERKEDIPLLARRCLHEFAERYPGVPKVLGERALEALLAYDWPGNVRELKSVVQQAAVLAKSSTLEYDALETVLGERRAESPSVSPDSSGQTSMIAPKINRDSLPVLQRRAIEDAWQASGHNLSAAARSLGLPRTTLRDRLKRYGLR